MPAGQYSIIMEQGSTFDYRIVYKDRTGSPISLVNWESRMHIRPAAGSPTLYCALSSSLRADGTGLNMTPISASVVLPKTSGSIGIYISAATSSQFTFNEAYYDLEIYSGSLANQYVIRLLEGKIKLKKEVTR